MKLLIIFLLSFNYLIAQDTKQSYNRDNKDTTDILLAKIVITMDTLNNVYLEFSKMKSVSVNEVLEVLSIYFREELKAIRKQKLEEL